MGEGLCNLCSGVREEGLVGTDRCTRCGVWLWWGDGGLVEEGSPLGKL